MVYDGTKSIAGNALFLTSVRALWELINAGSLAKLQPLIEPYAGGVLWDPVMVTVLARRAGCCSASLGILFCCSAASKKPLIGYERVR